MMDVLARAVLIALYPLLLAARVAALLGGRDPLRLREPEGSMWLERPPAPAARAYFAESDPAARPTAAGRLLQRAARAFAPRAGIDPAARASRALPDEIPDEVYTLW